MDNKALIWSFQLERDKRDRSGIYGYTQRTMAYNSNKIEGSTLTEDQTAALFEEGYLPVSDTYYRAKDIEEMNGHFLMFNKMLSSVGQKLTEEIIKAFHYELKSGVFEDRANGYAIGEYKERRNTVNGLRVASPDEVHSKMSELLSWYNQIENVKIEDLARLHAEYELIHPFQDGNGRTGRMILFKECLEKNIMPFIIHDEYRIEYITALKRAQVEKEPEQLATYFTFEQKQYEKQYEFFGVRERYQHYLQMKAKENRTR